MAASSSLLASQTLTFTLTNPTHKPHVIRFNPVRFNISKSKPISFISPQIYPIHTQKNSTIIASSSSPSSLSSESFTTSNPTHPLLTGSTRTLTTLFSIALTASKVFTHKLVSSNVHQALVHSAGPAFFAAMKDRPVSSLNTPLTVVAAGLAKWLDIYSGVLMVRVLLSWFPNIPWEKQPLSAIRDLCDPYLNLFRNIIPPIFNALDVSPLLAFAVLGTLGSILNSSRM